jgi:D-alanyl-D-alanine dipeptidase
VTSNPLVEIDAQALQVEIDLIYAGADNLAGKPIYQDPRCLLHVDAERCLRLASRLARQAGYSLRIFDAYCCCGRPCPIRNTCVIRASALITPVAWRWT